MTTSDAPAIEGFVEVLSAKSIAGWAWERGLDAALTVEILVGGRVIGQAVAGRFRKDLLEGGKGSGKHVFEFDFPAPVANFKTPGLVQAKVQGRDQTLRATEALLASLRTEAAPAARGPGPATARLTESTSPHESIGTGETTGTPAPVARPDARAVSPGQARPAAPLQLPAVAAGAAAATGVVIIVGTHGGPAAHARLTLLVNLCRRAFASTPELVETGAAASLPGVEHLVATSDLRTLAAAATAYAAGAVCQAVIVGAPTMPNMLIGALIRHGRGCPLLIDLDDQGAPVPCQAAPTMPGPEAAPDGDAWTEFARGLVGEADGVITEWSEFGRPPAGIPVRNGRDERHFNPATCDRAEVRAQFGYSAADRVIVFVGEPQARDGLAHDGLAELADALERLGDPRLALCIFGLVHEPELLEHLTSRRNARVALHPAQPLQRRPELIAMADCVPVLQRGFQSSSNRLPPLLIDALAMDVKVLATPGSAYADLAAAGAVQVVADAEALGEALRSLAGSAANGQVGLRNLFLAEFSHGVNAARLTLAIEAAARPRPRALPQTGALLRVLEERTGVAMPRVGPNGRRRGARAPLPPVSPARDLVMLCSAGEPQAGRAEAIGQHLLDSGRVRRVFLFGVPISAAALNALAPKADGPAAHRDSLIYAATMRRVLGVADTPGFARRTFLHCSGAVAEQAMGRELLPAQEHPAFVGATLRELGAAPSPLLWVFAPATGLGEVKRIVAPALVIACIGAGSPADEAAWRDAVVAEADLVLCTSDHVGRDFDQSQDNLIVLPEALEPADLIRRLWHRIEQTG